MKSKVSVGKPFTLLDISDGNGFFQQVNILFIANSGDIGVFRQLSSVSAFYILSSSG
jgi:hypothetical protein